MNMIAGLIRERQLPDLLTMKDGTVVTEENWEKRRQELLEIMGENLYGKMPEYVGTTTWHELSEEVNAAGKACTRKVEITFPTPDGKTFTFPVSVTIPFTARDASPKPAFVLVSFGYPKYYPMEEIYQSIQKQDRSSSDVKIFFSENDVRTYEEYSPRNHNHNYSWHEYIKIQAHRHSLYVYNHCDEPNNIEIFR